MNHKFLLEQSEPCRPVSQEQSPEYKSKSPALLQSPGHVNSKKIIDMYTQMRIELKDVW